jgi:hypothetical protein
MEFIITPHIGTDLLQFGMSRAIIRALFAELPEQFFHAGTEDTDYYPALGLFVLYDAAQVCVALEFTRPARVLLEGVDLLDLSKKEAIARFRATPDFEQDASGYTCYYSGFGAYYEQLKRAESVIAFEPGYYSL